MLTDEQKRLKRRMIIDMKKNELELEEEDKMPIPNIHDFKDMDRKAMKESIIGYANDVRLPKLASLKKQLNDQLARVKAAEQSTLKALEDFK